MTGRRPSGMAMAVLIVSLTLALTACSSSNPASTSSASGDPNPGMDVRASATPPEEPSEPGEEEEEEEHASPPAETIPPGAEVPDLLGREFEDAVIALRELGMDFGLVLARTSDEELWVVVKQVPQAGARPPEDRRVNIIVSMGSSAAGVGGIGPIQCAPEEDDIDEPYCLGKLIRYS